MNFLRKDKNDDEERNASSLGEKEVSLISIEFTFQGSRDLRGPC